tara:strand:+ start:255 stop:494 length:240 start_codon:yes stop_codon:yes gene_type:complete
MLTINPPEVKDMPILMRLTNLTVLFTLPMVKEDSQTAPLSMELVSTERKEGFWIPKSPMPNIEMYLRTLNLFFATKIKM